MLYLWVKYIHIISSTILFGTGLGTASVMLYAYFQKEIKIAAAIYEYIVIADWIFTGSSAIIQPLTGFLLVYIAGYSLFSFWVLGSIVGYLIAAVCWIIVVYLQIKIRDFASAAKTKKTITPRYYLYFKYWFILGWPAFISLLVVFYLMTFKPT